MSSASYSIYNLIAILSGYLGTQLIYLAYTVTTSLSASDEDSMLIVSTYTG